MGIYTLAVIWYNQTMENETLESLEKQSEMPSFNVVYECLGTCLLEIHGAGLAWRFNHRPQDFGNMIDHHIPGDIKDTTDLKRSISRFNKYKETLRDFVSSPIKAPNISQMYEPVSVDKTPHVAMLCIEPELLEQYDAFSEALESYVCAIEKYQTNTNTQEDFSAVLETAAKACATVRPSKWSDLSTRPDDVVGVDLRSAGPQLYLEAVMSKLCFKDDSARVCLLRSAEAGSSISGGSLDRILYLLDEEYENPNAF